MTKTGSALRFIKVASGLEGRSLEVPLERFRSSKASTEEKIRKLLNSGVESQKQDAMSAFGALKQFTNRHGVNKLEDMANLPSDVKREGVNLLRNTRPHLTRLGVQLRLHGLDDAKDVVNAAGDDKPLAKFLSRYLSQ